MKQYFEKHAPSALRAAKVLLRGRFELFPPRVTYALGPLHKAIKERFAFRGGTFFEVGANDGLTQSNTAYLARYLGWSGILVEALPNRFVECAQNRPEAFVAHAALVPNEYPEKYIEITYSDLMSATRLSELDVDMHVQRARQYLGTHSRLAGMRFLAPTRTAQSVIDEAGISEIDLFSLDVEGAELSVLKGIDFTRVRPRAFIIELRDPRPTTNFLEERGYGLETKLTRHDYLFTLQSA